MTYRCARLLALIAGLAGCGVGSVSPIVRDADLVDDPRLVGTWQDDSLTATAVITAVSPGKFDVLYSEKDGAPGLFHGRLGRLGSYRILDLQPAEPTPVPNDVYRSLVLRAHGMIVLDSVGSVVRFRMLEPDSLKAFLRRRPNAAAHARIDDRILLTGSSNDVRRFLIAFAGRKGSLGETNVFQRQP